MYHFIMNPTASSGMGRKVWKEIKPVLKDQGVNYSLNVFKKQEKLVSFIKALTSKSETQADNNMLNDRQRAVIKGAFNEPDVHIVVLGGDGTLNLVLNSIIDMDRTKLSCIRVGSGNDFARNVGVKKDAVKALFHLLKEPEEKILDYGEVEYMMPDGKYKKRRFIISSGIGYDADICEEVGRGKLKKVLNVIHLGKLVYVMIGIKQIFTRTNTKVKLCFDDKPPIYVPNLFFVVGMIHEMEGGGVPFCPHADPCDGMLDVCVARSASKPKLMLEVAMVYLKKHLMFSNIEEYRCKKLKVVVENSQWIHMDGETPCKTGEAVLSCKSGIRFIK